MNAVLILAQGIGAWAFVALIVWLGSAWIASSISVRKGYSEKAGLGTGMLLSALGVLIWLVIPARKGPQR
ncbi:MAG TPA: hypothetical protein PKB03_07325 [Baekduia sp.]|nr:hypothetical protein [Baekduia sp.]